MEPSNIPSIRLRFRLFSAGTQFHHPEINGFAGLKISLTIPIRLIRRDISKCVA